eukprot:m.618119 g.618119  ORF g.618119 m.618119 type:complete len:334 (-) comp58184_c1_seq1:102-1103(-)
MNLLTATLACLVLLGGSTVLAGSPPWVFGGDGESCDFVCGEGCSALSKQSMIDINTEARLDYVLGVAGVICDGGPYDFHYDSFAPMIHVGITCVYASTNDASYSCSATSSDAQRICCCNLEDGCPYDDNCPSEQYKNAGGTCVALTTCVLDTNFETVAPTATSDRVCGGAVTSCIGDTDYQTQAATLTSNRVCSTLTVCGAGETQTTPPTATSDRGCTKTSSVPAHGWMLATASQSCLSICSAAATSCTGATDCAAEAEAQACFEDSVYALTTKAEIKSIATMIGGDISICTRARIFANLNTNQALCCDEATVAPALCCCKQAGCSPVAVVPV